MNEASMHISMNDCTQCGTLVEPLGRCVGASDHALFVCFVTAF